MLQRRGSASYLRANLAHEQHVLAKELCAIRGDWDVRQHIDAQPRVLQPERDALG